MAHACGGSSLVSPPSQASPESTTPSPQVARTQAFVSQRSPLAQSPSSAHISQLFESESQTPLAQTESCRDSVHGPEPSGNRQTLAGSSQTKALPTQSSDEAQLP